MLSQKCLHTQWNWFHQLLLLGLLCCLPFTMAVAANQYNDKVNVSIECGQTDASKRDWKSSSIEDFPHQLAILLASNGSVFNNISRMSGDLWPDPDRNIGVTARNDIAWNRYLEPIFSNQLPTWLESSFNNLESNEFKQLSHDADIFSYGLHQTTQQNWASDYIHQQGGEASSPELPNPLGSLDDLKLLAHDFLYRKKWKRRSFGLSSVSNPMLISTLSTCDSADQSRQYRSLYLLNINSNGSNLSSDSTIGELLSVKRGKNKIEGFDHLFRALNATSSHYLLRPVSYAHFAPTKGVTSAMPNGDGGDIAQIFGDECKINCQRSLAASLVEVLPAHPLDSNNHYSLGQVPEFAFTKDGYTLDLDIKASDNASLYSLKSICARPKTTEDLEPKWQCHPAGTPWSFKWDLKIDDDEENAKEKPKVLQVKALYRYMPPNLDVGLVTEKMQEYRLIYESPGLLNDESKITHQLMSQHVELDSVDSVRKKVNTINTTASVRNELNEKAIIIIAMVLLIGVIILVTWYFRTRFPKPKLVLDVRTEATHASGGKLSNDDANDTAQEVVTLRDFKLQLDEAEAYPEVLIGYFSIANKAGTNAQKAWETLTIDEVGIRVITAAPENIGTKMSLLISDKESHRDVILKDKLQWPIILNANNLEDIRTSLFQDAKLDLKLEVYLVVNHPHLVKDHSEKCRLTISITPASYRYEPVLRLPENEEFPNA